MPSTWTLISTGTVTSSSQSSIAFTSISNNYSDLMIIGSIRSTRNGGDAAQVMMRINGATSNYAYGGIHSDGAGSYFQQNSTSTNYAKLGFHSQATADQTNNYSGWQITIPNKLPAGAPLFVGYGAQERNVTYAYGGYVGGANTGISGTNVTSLEFFSQPDDSFQFVQHSTISLYGLTRA